MDSDFDGSIVFVGPDNVMYLKRKGANLAVSSTITVEYKQWAADLTLASESLPGLINDHEDMIVNRCVRRYLQNKRFDDPKITANMILAMDVEYERMLKLLKRHIRSHGEPGITRYIYEWR